MAKRKKRPAQRSKDSDFAATPAPARLPPANPPRRQPALLAISLLLFAGWFGFLIYVALRTNS